MRHGCRWGLTAAIRALAARPAPFQPGQIGSSGDVRQIPVFFVTEEPSAGQARTGNGRADMRRRLTGLARMAIPARSQPGRGRSRAAARQCRGGGSLAMAVKAQVTAASVPRPRPGTPGVGGAVRPGIASFRPPVAGAPPRLVPRDRQVPGPAWRPATSRGHRLEHGARTAEAPWSPSTGRPRRTRPDQAGKDGSFSGAIPGALTARDAHSCMMSVHSVQGLSSEGEEPRRPPRCTRESRTGRC